MSTPNPAYVRGSASIEDVLAALAVEPCHTSGQHTPNHHTRFLCRDQKAEILDRLLAVLGMSIEDLPHRLHGPDCYWCHHVPSQERFREDLRQSWAWAGVPLTEELAAPAPDAEVNRDRS